MNRTVKGGVWKNTEDEILKVAVMKYGKNQWARISSLLVRKTPKQCKARWYEWIDPSIKKTEWSKEEEEKLLHLAKIMPTQWRTIAPIVGRTASQCLEHYEKLLDAAQEKAAIEGEPSGLSSIVTSKADDPRRFRPGEVDPSPETKPARPDPVDMDEDEKEMLSEARARLANTQGKKAKRKAREKQLEEARRLASLQKRRELKAAGIKLRGYRIRGMNYNIDIPFERKPPPGFFDTAEELEKEKSEKFLERSTRPKIKPELRRMDAELEERKKDAKKRKEREQIGAPDLNRLKRLTEERFQIGKRSKLILPNPTLTDNELEQFVKLGLSSEEAKAMVLESGSTPASVSLMADYSTPLRTPSTLSHRPSMVLSTPRSVMTSTSSTPLRDDFQINEPNPMEEEMRRKAWKKRLELDFSKLPQPKNDFEIVVPELAPVGEEILERGKGESVEDFAVDFKDRPTNFKDEVLEDAMDIDKRRDAQRKREDERQFNRLPLAIQKNLPLPSLETYLENRNKCKNIYSFKRPSMIDLLIEQEMELLLKEQLTASSSNLFDAFSHWTDMEMDQVNWIVEQELEKLRESFERDWDDFSDRHFKVWKNTDIFGISDQEQPLTSEERTEIMKNQFLQIKKQMAVYASKAKQLEQQAHRFINPYKEQLLRINQSILEMGENMSTISVDLNTLVKNTPSIR